MFRPLSVSLAALTASAGICAPAQAQTFEAEARAAVSSSPVLAGERARVRAVRQALPQAAAEFLPQITAEAAAIERDSSESRFAFTIREQDEYWIASVRVSTLLFGSGRVQGTTRQARAQIASAIAQHQNAMQDFTVEFTQAYANVRFSLETLAAQEESLSNLEEQARFARANLREGFMTRTDVAQAEARVALARADLARARANVVEASEFFQRLTGRPPGALAPVAHMQGLPMDLESAYAIAEDNHPALAAAAANVQAADAAVDVAASAGRVRIFLDSTNSTFDAISRNDFSQEFESSVSVRATVPLFTGGATTARTRQQRYVREASRYELIDVQRRVRELVAVSWSRLDAARARLEASRARLEAAELASRGVQREQQHGQRSMIDVLNQEQERLSARVALAEAERDVAIAERTLAASVGYLPQMLGIGVEPGR
jgi:outer membrane protein